VAALIKKRPAVIRAGLFFGGNGDFENVADIAGGMEMSIEMIRSFFMWCSVINIGLLLFGFVMFWTGRCWIYKVHSKLFNISEENFTAIWYLLLALYKTEVILFNVIPCIALYIIG